MVPADALARLTDHARVLGVLVALGALAGVVLIGALGAVAVVCAGLLAGFLVAQVGQQPARDQDLALALGQVVGEGDLLIAVDLGGDLVRALRKLLLEVGQGSGLPNLGAVVVALVVKSQRDDALGDQVAAVDAGKRLGDHRLYPEMKRRQCGVLAR